jgi:hypothetical protein
LAADLEIVVKSIGAAADLRRLARLSAYFSTGMHKGLISPLQKFADS